MMKLLFKRKYIIIILFSMVVASLIYYGLIVNKRGANLSNDTKINKPIEETEPAKDTNQFTSLIGEWEVKRLRCLPRASITSEDEASKSEIIGKKLKISKNLKVIFDNDAYNDTEVSKLSSKNIMNEYNLFLNDALSFGDNVTRLYFENPSAGFTLLLLNDNTLVIKVTELFNTDGFYILERVGQGDRSETTEKVTFLSRLSSGYVPIWSVNHQARE